MADDGEYLPLAAVAERTGISLRTIREWCATGRLACERSDGAWALRTADVEKVRQLRLRPPPARRQVTFILPAERATAEVKRKMLRLLPPEGTSMARLSIDDMDYVAFSVDAEAEAETIGIARVFIEGVGGQLLDP